MPVTADQIFVTSSETLQTLMLRNQFYYIPAYQRQYNWTNKSVLRLLESVVHGFIELIGDCESYTFLGTIITIKDQNFATVDAQHRPDLPASVQLLIDGQQRVTTLVLFLIACHARLRKSYERLQAKGEAKTELDQSVANEIAGSLEQIRKMLISDEFIPPAASIPFVRIIRAFDDSWSRIEKENKYTSPIAGIIFDYAITTNGANLGVNQSNFVPFAFPRGSDKNVCRTRYFEIVNLMRGIYSVGIGEEALKIPNSQFFLRNPAVIKEFLTTISEEGQKSIGNLEDTDPIRTDLMDLLFTKFLLQRVVLTAVSVQKDEYAYAVFDSLNTTGQALAPFEMFRPLVMQAVGLNSYRTSKEKMIVDDIANNLGQLDIKKNLTDAEKITINFALSESGHRLGTDPIEQRNYYRISFKRTAGLEARISYLQNLLTVSNLHKNVFNSPVNPRLSNNPDLQVSDEAATCLSFLAKSKHTLAVPILARFWDNVLVAYEDGNHKSQIRQFEEIAKGLTAFICLFRAVSTNTDGIDQVLRDIVSGESCATDIGPLHRSDFNFLGEDKGPLKNQLNSAKLLNELLKRLSEPKHRGITDRKTFVEKAKKIGIYESSQPISRFLLFSAFHDNAYDEDNPGLLVKGLSGSNSLINLSTWTSEDAISVEHVAPKTNSPASGWDRSIYDDNALNSIGNLTLCPQSINSALGNESWDRKRFVYKALGLAIGLDAAKGELLRATPPFKGVVDKLNDERIGHCKFFGNIGKKTDDWDRDFIELRTINLLEFAWDRLITWIPGVPINH
jgi:hypothetical protein